MTIGQRLKDFAKKLSSIYDERESVIISEWVFENVFNIKKWQIRNNGDQVEKKFISQLERYLDELLAHKPVQYVLNEAWFYKRKFFVDESVLIPRPETEELVTHVIKWIKSNHATRHPMILDVGTGSGCIAIALKLEFPAAQILAVDVSTKALQIARRNAESLGVEIELLEMNFLNEGERDRLPLFDVVVSNPPYIPTKEKISIPANVLSFEPHVALFTPDEDPEIFYREIALFCCSHLTDNGKIFVETHESYQAEVKNIFESENFLCETFTDIYGKPRVIAAS